MSHFRIQHVFWGLMALSAIVAFAMPARVAGQYQPQIQVLFWPVSRPVASVARAVTHRVSPPAATDSRPDMDIRAENDRLRAANAWLQAQLAEANRKDHELGKLGTLKDRCLITKVVGADSGTRESIQISGTSWDGFKPDMYVLSSDGLVGQIARVWLGGGQVRLVSDPSFRIRCRFWRFEASEMRPLAIPPVLVQGNGNGQLRVLSQLPLSSIGLDTNLHAVRNADGPTLAENDYVVVDDGDCPPLKGVKIGRVAQIERRRDARLFAEVLVRPATNLKRLSEVMVMTKEQ
jgi:cell shape-determining protein MreC